MGVWEMRPNPEADETLINPNREEALFALALEKPAAMCDVRCARAPRRVTATRANGGISMWIPREIEGALAKQNLSPYAARFFAVQTKPK